MHKNTGRAPAGPRGLSKTVIIHDAIALMEEGGENGFSVRKLGERVGCDPMAILYHFKNKDGLFRAMADALTAKLEAVGGEQPWDARLREHARQYRALALEWPNTFSLTQRFLNTGASDFAHIEMVHGALADAGVPDEIAPAVCLGWYASMIGLCMGEIGGLIRPASAADAQEVEQLPATEYPCIRRFIPLYRDLETDEVFETANNILIQGIRHYGRQARDA